MKERGLLVLDAHLNQLDIFFTAVWLRKEYKHNIIHMPVAAYFFYMPIIKSLFGILSKIYSITLHPVYRAADFTPSKPLEKRLSSFFPKSLTWEKAMVENKKYLNTVTDSVTKKDQIVILSPYGGYSKYAGKIKYGVRMLIELNPNILITKTEKFKTKSKSLGFDGMSQKEMQDHLLKSFNSL